MDDDIRKALTERVSVSVNVAGRALGLRRNSAYAAAKRGDIPNFRVGGKIVCPTAPLRRMLGLDNPEAA